MGRRLTPEFAEFVDLSRNPLKRNSEVRELLDDPSIVGEDVKVEVNPPSVVSVTGGNVLIMNSVIPLLGRSSLKRAAKSLEVLDKKLGEEHGENI